MVGQLQPVGCARGRGGVVAGQRLAPGPVEAPSLGRQHRVIGRFLQQRVTEAIGIIVVGRPRGNEQPRIDQLSHVLTDGVAVITDDLDERLVLDHPPAHGSDAEHVLSRLRKHVDTGEQHIAQPPRQSLATVAARCEQFLDEEGVAIRARPDGIDLLGRQLLVQDGADEQCDLRLGERLKIDAFDRTQPRHLCQPGSQGVAPRDLVSAEGGHDGDGLLLDGTQQERGSGEGARVGPVEVFELEDERVPLRATAEQRQQRLVQSRLRPQLLAGHGFAGAERRDQTSEITSGATGRRGQAGGAVARHQGTQDLGVRGEGQAFITHRYAAADEDRCTTRLGTQARF